MKSNFIEHMNFGNILSRVLHIRLFDQNGRPQLCIRWIFGHQRRESVGTVKGKISVAKFEILNGELYCTMVYCNITVMEIKHMPPKLTSSDRLAQQSVLAKFHSKVPWSKNVSRLHQELYWKLSVNESLGSHKAGSFKRFAFENFFYLKKSTVGFASVGYSFGRRLYQVRFSNCYSPFLPNVWWMTQKTH